MAAQLLHIGDTVRIDLPAVSGLDAEGDGVLGPALGQRGSFHQLLLAGALCGVDAGHFKGALGQGAGLVEHNDAGAGQLFQIGGTLTRMPQADAPPMPPKKLRGMLMTSAQGQLITRKVRAR